MVLMSIEDIASSFMEKLQQAMDNWNTGEPSQMLGLLNQLQKDAYTEGYQHAIDILQEGLVWFLERTVEI